MAEGRDQGSPPAGTTVDLRHTTSSLGGALPGYGLTRSSARERAAVVRAVTADTHIRQRPMPVVVVTALVALVGLGIWCWQLYTAISEEGPLTTLFWAGLATFLVAAAICSWAWQLYDVRKAIVMWFAIVVLGIAAALIIAVVLVALKGDGDADIDLDLDGLLEKITGDGARDAGTFVDRVALPVVIDAADMMGGDAGGYGDAAGVPAASQEQAPPGTPACPSCGRALTTGLLICPRCGTDLG